MTTMPPISSRLFWARSLRILSYRRFEAQVDLDFGVMVHKTFLVDGVERPTAWGEETRARAKHCLIVLLGGRRLLLQPDPRTRGQWHELAEIKVRAYRVGRMHGSPVGYVEALPEAGGPALDIAAYLSWLGAQRPSFEKDLLLETLNGDEA